MQLRRNYNNSTERFKYYLHSIPKLLLLKEKAKYSINEDKNVKSNVLYSIPSVVVLVLLFGLFIFHEESYAAYCVENCPAPDATTISPVPTPTPATPTASLSLNSSSLTSNAVVPGEIAVASTGVTVNVSNASSYSLTLKMDSTNLTNGSTTITAGNPGDSSKSNVWGYKWDTASTYTAPTTAGTNLSVPALSNGAASFTKVLTFGAKFASNANAGAYHGSGTLSLIATPQTVAAITLANLTQMQQLAEGYAPEACANTPYLSGKNYSETYTLTDVRDNNTYTVAKLGDGKCWMTSNLKLTERNVNSSSWYDRRSLNSTTSDVSTSWTLPASSTSGFSNNTASNVYLGADANGTSTGYYTWCAATAGTCSSAPNANDIAPSSICPKGWKLPTGGRTYTAGSTSEFYNLILNGIFKDSSNISTYKNNTASQHYFSDSNAVNTLKGSPYNFAFTGYVLNGSYYAPASNQLGYWWSSTANDSTRAYYLSIASSSVYPGTNVNYRYLGFAVRCVAK